MTASMLTNDPHAPTPPQRDFRAWVDATSAPEELALGIDGFTYADLYQPARLAELTRLFHASLREHDKKAADGLDALARGGGKLATATATSEAFIAAAAHLSTFVAKLFRVEDEVAALRRSLLDHDPVWAFKRDFVKKRVAKADASKGAALAAAARLALGAAGADGALLGAGSEAEEAAVARATLRLLEVEDTARKVAKAGGAV